MLLRRPLTLSIAVGRSIERPRAASLFFFYFKEEKNGSTLVFNRQNFKSASLRERSQVSSAVHTQLPLASNGRRSGHLAIPLTERIRTRRRRYFQHSAQYTVAEFNCPL